MSSQTHAIVDEATRPTIKDFKLIKLTAGLKVFNSEGDVVARLHFNNPGARLEMREAGAW